MTQGLPATRDEAIDWLRKHFHADAARGVRAVFQLDLAGNDGGGIQLRIDDGQLEVLAEPAPTPHVRLRLAADDYYGVLAGRENADLLYMDGRLEIDGDLSLAMKLRTLFRAPR